MTPEQEYIKCVVTRMLCARDSAPHPMPLHKVLRSLVYAIEDDALKGNSVANNILRQMVVKTLPKGRPLSEYMKQAVLSYSGKVIGVSQWLLEHSQQTYYEVFDPIYLRRGKVRGDSFASILCHLQDTNKNVRFEYVMEFLLEWISVSKNSTKVFVGNEAGRAFRKFAAGYVDRLLSDNPSWDADLVLCFVDYIQNHLPLMKRNDDRKTYAGNPHDWSVHNLLRHLYEKGFTETALGTLSSYGLYRELSSRMGSHKFVVPYLLQISSHRSEWFQTENGGEFIELGSRG